MILFSILFFMTIYAAISIAFLVFVRSRTERPLYSVLAAILIVLIPSWDMVLGAIVYFPSCLFFPKVAIYETAETDGIYYEGMHDYFFQRDRYTGKRPETTYDVIEGPIDKTIKHGFRFVEGKSEQRPSFLYRCHEDTWRGRQVAKCTVVDEIKSKYLVKYTSMRIGTAEMRINKIIERSTGKLMAKNRSLIFDYSFPFFYWLYQPDGPPKSISCSRRKPSGTGIYHPLAFDVLEPKK